MKNFYLALILVFNINVFCLESFSNSKVLSLTSLALRSVCYDSTSHESLKSLGDVCIEDLWIKCFYEINPDSHEFSLVRLYSLFQTSLVNNINLPISLRTLVSAYQISPDGRSLVIGFSTGIVRLYNIENLKCEFELQLHNAKISSISWNHRSSLFVAGAHDGVVKVCNAKDGRCISQTHIHSSQSKILFVCWLCDSSQILTESTKKIVIWDINTSTFKKVDSYNFDDCKIDIKINDKDPRSWLVNHMKLDLFQMLLLLKVSAFGEEILQKQVDNLFTTYRSLPSTFKRFVNLKNGAFKYKVNRFFSNHLFLNSFSLKFFGLV